MASESLELGRAVIEKEAQALSQLAAHLDREFETALDLIQARPGKLVLAGVGKSGLVARKIAATLSSTGTPALFLHAAEAGHGDLGMIGPEDAVLILSKSGASRELAPLMNFCLRRSIPMIAVTGKAASELSLAASVNLRLPEIAEADLNDLVPTTSTTMMIALGDALALALIHRKGFGAQDFAELHPSGQLGAQLTRIDQLEGLLDPAPHLTGTESLSQVAQCLTDGGLGCALILEGSEIRGIVTDGDLRRALTGNFAATAAEIMTSKPLTIAPETSAAKALALLETRKITQLVVATAQPTILHLHNLLRAGVA